MKKESKKQDEQVGEILKNSLTGILKDQFDFDFSAEEVEEVSAEDKRLINVASSLGVVSLKSEGVIVLAFTRPVFFSLLKKLFGEDVTEVDDENSDLAAEVLNMGFGKMKATFYQRFSTKIQPSIPSAVYGDKLSCGKMFNSCLSLYRLRSEKGNIYVGLKLRDHEDEINS